MIRIIKNFKIWFQQSQNKQNKLKIIYGDYLLLLDCFLKA